MQAVVHLDPRMAFNAKLLNRQKRHARGIVAIATSPGTEALFTGSRDTMVRPWLPQGEAFELLYLGGRGSVNDVVLTADGKYFVTSTVGGTISIAERQSLRTLRQFQIGKGSVLSLAMSPDSNLLATAHTDSKVRIFDAWGDLKATLSEPLDNVTGLAFSPWGGLMVTASSSRNFILWNGLEGELIAPLQSVVFSNGNRASRSTVRFSPNGLEIAIASGSELCIYSYLGSLLRGCTFEAPIHDIAYSPCGSRLAIAGGDGLVQILAVQDFLKSGRSSWTEMLQGHRASVEAIAFSGTGQYLYSGDAAGELITWQVDSSAETSQYGLREPLF